MMKVILIVILILIGHVSNMLGKSHKSAINKLQINDLMAIIDKKLIEIGYIADPEIKDERKSLIK